MARERSVSDVCEVLALGWSFRGEFFLCISRGICTVPSLYRPSTDSLIFVRHALLHMPERMAGA